MSARTRRTELLEKLRLNSKRKRVLRNFLFSWYIFPMIALAIILDLLARLINGLSDFVISNKLTEMIADWSDQPNRYYRYRLSKADSDRIQRTINRMREDD